MGSTGGPEDKKQHRKLQNRANQRARRLRLREKDGGFKTIDRGQFGITRWRMPMSQKSCGNEGQSAVADGSESLPHSTKTHDRAERKCPLTEADKEGKAYDLSLDGTIQRAGSPKQDLLLTLIQYNVLRGMFDNKLVLMGQSSYFTLSDQVPVPLPKNSYPSQAIVLPTKDGLPASLQPTKLQMTVEHWTWIDMLPFPRMRENFIKLGPDYDPSEFALDTVGDIFSLSTYYKRPTPADDAAKEPSSLPGDDEMTTLRRGFIVWGEPFDPGSWEVTPGFLRKWASVMEGCEYLIESSNRWREARGEEPLSFDLASH